MAAVATPQQLADLVQQQQADEAAALEEQTAEEADGGAGGALAGLVAVALAAWVAAFGALAVIGGGLMLARLLAGLRADVDRAASGLGRRSRRVLEGALADAAGMGARHAVDFARRASGDDIGVPGVDVPEAALDAARGLTDVVTEQLRLAARLLAPRTISGSGWRGVVLALAAAKRAATLVRQTVAWAVHRAVNDGAAQVAQQLGARGLWVAEPDACVRCLAYAGHLTDRDGHFPGGLSMDPHSRSTLKAAIEGPPLHPACRCRLVPWMPDWGTGPGSLPELLRDQAWRSIAAGRGRPTESHAARRRAARALLARRGLSARVRRQATATAAGRS
ncbi:hypothetical protein [Streptomyces sp. NPDC001530]|uniref:hypothetical protein n=1 Tax=Streptomyces sp. NPDC001530 TaxID=3364582 RepID=UPI0036972A42